MVVLDESMPQSKVILYECGHTAVMRGTREWDGYVVPRLLREQHPGWPRGADHRVRLVVLHWVMGRKHFEPALPSAVTAAASARVVEPSAQRRRVTFEVEPDDEPSPARPKREASGASFEGEHRDAKRSYLFPLCTDPRMIEADVERVLNGLFLKVDDVAFETLQVHTCTCAHVQTHTHMHTHACTHTCTHSHMHTLTHAVQAEMGRQPEAALVAALTSMEAANKVMHREGRIFII